MAFSSCFTNVDQVVLAVAHNTNRCATVNRYHSHFTRWHTKGCILSFLRHKLCTVACGADQLSSFSRVQLHIVDHGTNRDILKRQAVAQMHLCFRSVHDGHAVGQALRCKNICFLTVCIADQCDISGSVGIVLNSDHFCRNSVFPSLEINNSVFSLVSASAVSHSDFTLSVTTGVLFQRSHKGFLRSTLGDLREIISGHMSSGRCIWAISFDSHYFVSFRSTLIVMFVVNI